MKNVVSVKDRMLDISVNLARIGNWTADSYKEKESLIQMFLNQTVEYVNEVRSQQISEDAKIAFMLFQKEFKKLLKEKVTEKNKNEWAERALTWANILQHRAKLA